MRPIESPSRYFFATWLILVGLTLVPRGHTAVRFYALGDLPGGLYDSGAAAVAADGSMVVGVSNSSNSQFEAFRWTKATGIQPLPNLSAGTVLRGAAASGDLIRIVGTIEGSSPTEGARWTLGVGIESVGDLPGGGALTFATGISPDGQVVVGASNSTDGRQAFRWTSQAGIQALGDLAGGEFFSQATDASANGSVVVGISSSSNGNEAFLWNQTTGMRGLGDLPGMNFFSWATAVAADGSVVVGYSNSESGTEAFRWTTALNMQGMGDLPGGEFNSGASDVSADGSFTVGWGTSFTGRQAVFWDANLQIQAVQGVLAANGLDLPGWTLTTASDISDNGRHIVGSGINPSGNYEAWLVSFLPDPPTIALAGKPKVRAKPSGKFKLRGTAADDAAVVRVEYQIGGKGRWKPARGTDA